MSDTDSTVVVPFGKHKGQPVEVLLADDNYTQWLMAQTWFAEKYAAIFAMLQQSGVAPEDTPEHNLMQARFLDDDLIKRITARLEVSAYGGVQFEVAGWDVVIGEPYSTHVCLELKPTISDDYPTILRTVIRRSDGGDGWGIHDVRW